MEEGGEGPESAGFLCSCLPKSIYTVTMDYEKKVSRRDFLHRLGVLGIAGVGASSFLVACDSGGTMNEENGGEENGGGDVAETFEVTVGEIDDSYPYSEQNNIGTAYAIDGEVGKVITLERGKTYEFRLQGSVEEGPNGFSHPFYVGTTAEGQGGDEYRDEPANQTSGTVTFTPPSDAPDTLYYQCEAHQYMGGEMEITDAQDSDNEDY